MFPRMILAVFVSILLASATTGRADRLELLDGTVIEGSFVRDEGARLLVWERFEDVGRPNFRIIPRARVKRYDIDRPPSLDEHPSLPDLTVTFIEMNPKLAGLHGQVQYDRFGRPHIAGAPTLADIGDDAYLEPERVVKNLKLRYDPGEPIRLTAHVKNVGFAPAEPFAYAWAIDGEPVERGEFTESLAEMDEATFALKTKWLPGRHTVTFTILTDQAEIAQTNNAATDPLWGWGLVFIVNRKRVEAWHQNRTAYGTFSFEDFYRWHLDIMNNLFTASVYPSAPDGIRARVRLDRILYTDDVEAAAAVTGPDGIRYDQGRWIWLDDDDRNGTWKPPTHEWRNRTEWSLPHELGHQLGLVDLYALDYEGHEAHTVPDTGEPITHFMTHPQTMMHWHGPNLWSEIHAGYLNRTWDKPRGYYGDFYFEIPRENFLRIVDVNGRDVPNAQVEIFQRGAVVDPDGKPGEDHGVRYFPVVEDGSFDHPVSREPVIIGTTDSNGVIRLPNRPVQPVRTLNGFERRPNPFGNMNVVGQRGLLLVRVTKEDRPAYFWLEITDFVVASFRGQTERFTITLKTPYGSVDSPPSPETVTAQARPDAQALVSWAAPNDAWGGLRRIIGYRVYRRISNDGLNDRPWFPVATLGPAAREALISLENYPEDIYWYSKVTRFAVSAIGERGIESALTETVFAPDNGPR